MVEGGASFRARLVALCAGLFDFFLSSICVIWIFVGAANWQAVEETQEVTSIPLSDGCPVSGWLTPPACNDYIANGWCAAPSRTACAGAGP